MISSPTALGSKQNLLKPFIDDSFRMTENESVQSKTLVPESSEYETEYGTESANESVSVKGLKKLKK